MNDWDDLAEAAAERAGPSLPPHTKQSLLSRVLSVFIIVVVLAGCTAALIVAAKRSAYRESGAAPIPASQPANVASPAGEVDPGFTIERVSYEPREGYAWIWWRLTNRDSNPLLVQEVRLNGEYSAAVADWNGQRALPSSTRRLPISVSPGDELLLFQQSPSNPSYSKPVTYVDIRTDRGTFRWKEGRFALVH